jgi:hypothetical protein
MTAKKPTPCPIGGVKKKSAHQPWRPLLPFGLLFSVPQFLRGENQVAYRYEFYTEDNHRMEIQTHSVYFEQKLLDAVTAKGELIYDGISGATPRGVPNAKSVAKVKDIRRAWNLAVDWKLKANTVTPAVAYSKEIDYESKSVSLNDALEFNSKNTVLKFGVSHNFDSVRDNSKTKWQDKDTTEVMIGISQLLSPKTVATLNFTYGDDAGYLSDPYRVARYNTFGFAYPEQRPTHKSKQIALASITQYFESLNASLEGSYRFHHDSFQINSHTVGVTWHQKLGKHLIVEPMFRYYTQNAADFYAPSFSGIGPSGGNFSADYRLSKLYSLDFGLQATVLLNDHIRIVGGYHRYQMNGTDNKTDPGMYPSANIFTVGVNFLW